ncbi:MAG: molybdenum cofactor biosynthesis protein B [Alphaproteobacteria bacterium]
MSIRRGSASDKKGPPGGGTLDTSLMFTPLRIAVLTVSDTRDTASDRSGDILAGRITDGGHELVERALVRDDPERIRGILEVWIASSGIDVILTTGGTGITARDCTPEVVEAFFTRKLDGFGEYFRRISSDIIGTSALQSRAVGGVCDRTFIFALPGSPSACEDAWDYVLRWQFDSRLRPCNLAEMVPRL